jgi:hypothetical protein
LPRRLWRRLLRGGSSISRLGALSRRAATAISCCRVENTGDASTDGSPVTVTDRLPAGLTATAADGMEYFSGGGDVPLPGNWDCLGVGSSTVTCVNDPSGFPGFVPTFYNGWGLINEGTGPNPAEFRTMPPPIGIAVSVAGSASGALTNEASVSGPWCVRGCVGSQHDRCRAWQDAVRCGRWPFVCDQHRWEP